MDAKTGREDCGQPFTRRAALLGSASLGLGAVAASARPARAQEATPPVCPGAMEIGDIVPFVSVEGQEVGTLAITEVVDPFAGYSPNYPPPRGNRFVLLTMTCRNTGTNPWGVDAGRVFLQDSEGFVIYPASVDLGPEPAVPAFGYQEIPPGGEFTGVIGYVLLKGVEPLRVFFTPSSDRLVLLAELPFQG